MNKTILLKNRPKGRPTLDDFEFKEIEKPSPKEGEVLLKTKYVSVDPYLRGRMRDEKSYIEPFQLNEPVESGIIAEVIESNSENFKKGDYVNGMLQWKQFQTSNGKGLQKVDGSKAPLSAYLGVLGLTGITAYLGLKKIGDLEKGETLLVSGASGAVGTVVGQIGKIKGCKVVGIAGTDEKIKTIKEKFHFDEGINYKTTDNMKKAIAEACPNGVDVYYDNVGGEILDAAMANINYNGRVVCCGAISLYNKTEQPTGPRHETTLIKKSVLMQGFTVRDYQEEFPAAIQQLATWLQEDKLTYSETIVEGFDEIPQAFIDLFDGKNKGKMIVKV
ncbi:NADP-dependent oxidoreductase [Marixanthomonas spongiae]|uniref:NADP-dependent oxidoreductase n=1 Tax=Marixanthomonas spongiae TaxID=2174845 RepID=A0A2U0I270_9FLAO|nr:NADP-dependent oxidoreductase [Marixanthomonas spongiae]PVW15207.1 NADP-dependent oxidoreductase [Marixanthomonas spongiae]